jgi:repressor LexA
VGEIAAGGPILAEERVESVYSLPRDLVGEGQLFMLKVRGESMIEAGVLDGDLVVVREQSSVEQGEMCAVLIDGEATVKFFRRTRAGEVFLDPANEAYEPIPVTPDQDASIMGKVVTVMRAVR